MDTALYAIYDDAHKAQRAAQQLMALGIDQHAIRLIGPAALAVAERDHAGSYGDSGEHMHGGERDHAGSYGDSGEHMHGGERDHVGSFASVEPVRRGTPNTVDALKAAGLSPEDAHSYAARVDAGAAVLLVQVSEERAAQAAAILRAT